MILHLKQVDPWRAKPDYDLPAIEVEYLKVRIGARVDDAWTAEAVCHRLPAKRRMNYETNFNRPHG